MAEKYYVFFTRSTLPSVDKAHLVHDVHSANAAANLGYPTVLVYLKDALSSYNPLDWIQPFHPKSPHPALVEFYNIQDRLKTVDLAMPWPFGKGKGGKWTSRSTLVSKYYFPIHIFAKTGILHTLDWNLVKVAIQHQIPVIYEREHFQSNPYDLEIVQSPYFQVAVTVADPIRQDMIKNGMPPDKIIQLPLGYNQAFLARHSAAAQWRQDLLGRSFRHLVVYSGGLYSFKGVDLLLEVAQSFPDVKFAFAGGDSAQVDQYRGKVRALGLQNAEFLGYLPHGRLPGLLQAADALAHPHLSGEASTFTSPLKLFDYLASGTPIVASRIAALENGPFDALIDAWCEPDQPQAFANGLRQILTTKPRPAQGFVRDPHTIRQFSWEARIEAILEHVDDSYKRVLGKPNVLSQGKIPEDLYQSPSPSGRRI
jgi:glycosyltransferase involved in cell wall biosynthesis